MKAGASEMTSGRIKSMTGWAAALLLYCTAALAQPDPSATLERLDDPDYAVREAATRTLLRDETITLDQLRELFGRSETPEQRHRLLNIARHHVLRVARQRDEREVSLAAIGFSHEILPPGMIPQVDHAGVYIVSTLPGFPGHTHFEAGDILIEVNDQPLPLELTADGFKELLRRFRPGQVIAATVLRDNQRERMEFSLASLDMLQTLYGDGAGLRPAYMIQWQAVRDHLQRDNDGVPTLSPTPRDE